VTALVLLFVLCGLLLVAAGMPLARRRVRPNRWYGLRVPATLKDEEIWFEANARCGRELAFAGAVLTAAALALPAVLPDPSDYALTASAVLTVSTLTVCLRGLLHAARLRQAKRESESGS